MCFVASPESGRPWTEAPLETARARPNAPSGNPWARCGPAGGEGLFGPPATDSPSTRLPWPRAARHLFLFPVSRVVTPAPDPSLRPPRPSPSDPLPAPSRPPARPPTNPPAPPPRPRGPPIRPRAPTSRRQGNRAGARGAPGRAGRMEEHQERLGVGVQQLDPVPQAPEHHEVQPRRQEEGVAVEEAEPGAAAGGVSRVEGGGGGGGGGRRAAEGGGAGGGGRRTRPGPGATRGTAVRPAPPPRGPRPAGTAGGAVASALGGPSSCEGPPPR